MFKKKLDQAEVIRQGVIAGLLEAAYIFFVALMMVGAGNGFGTRSTSSIIFGAMAFLILFVLSAGISGVLVLGLPIYHAFEKQYKEALLSFASTSVSLLVIFAILIMFSAMAF